MPVLGLTGGIATGKSTVAQLLRRELPGLELFDADRCVHDLLASDDGVRDAIKREFGPGVIGIDERPDRGKLRELVFSDEGRRRALESILHPAVRAQWTDRIRSIRSDSASFSWLLVDIPLLYETGVQAEFDRVIVVACAQETQERRLTHERGLAPELARRIMGAQFDLGQKVQQADHVIWNDSTVSNLDGQSRLLAAWLRQRFAR